MVFRQVNVSEPPSHPSVDNMTLADRCGFHWDKVSQPQHYWHFGCRCGWGHCLCLFGLYFLGALIVTTKNDPCTLKNPALGKVILNLKSIQEEREVNALMPFSDPARAQGSHSGFRVILRILLPVLQVEKWGRNLTKFKGQIRTWIWQTPKPLLS